jgi:hypothetical protein
LQVVLRSRRHRLVKAGVGMNRLAVAAVLVPMLLLAAAWTPS